MKQGAQGRGEDVEVDVLGLLTGQNVSNLACRTVRCPRTKIQMKTDAD